MNKTALLLFLLLFTGCPKRIDFGKLPPVQDPAVLLKLTTAAESTVQSVSGEGRLGVDSPQGKGSLGLFAAAARPARLHLEQLDFFGRPQLMIACDGERLGIYVVGENRYYRGPATPANLARWLPVALSPEELTSIALGQAPRVQASAEVLSVDEKSQAYVVTRRGDGVTQTLWIHPIHHRVMRSEVRGAVSYDVSFEDFDTAGPAAFPRKITLVAPAAHASLEVRYGNITLNGAVDDTLFSLEPPEGVELVELDAEGRQVAK